MLEDSNLGVKGWAAVSPVGSASSSGSTAPEPKPKSKPIKKEPEAATTLKDAIAEYREKEKSIERIAKKLDKEPETLAKCKAYIKAAQDVLQDTSGKVALLDTCQQELLEDFEIAMVSPGKFNNFKKTRTSVRM